MKALTPVLWLLIPTSVLADDVSSQLDEVVVSDSSDPAYPLSGSPVTTLAGDELLLKTGTTIGETLKNELGVQNQSFGPGVGTPMIRGQSGPRVRVLNNGIGSNDASALSPDHAVSVDPLTAESIEIIKGPASLLYGGGAVGGVVNVLDQRIPDQARRAGQSTVLEQRFNSVSDETSSAIKHDGATDQLAWHLDGFYKQHGDMGIAGTAIDSAKTAITDPGLDVVQNSSGKLTNTGAEAISGSAGLSWLMASGFAGLSINSLNNHYGIAPDGSGDEQTRIAMQQNKYDFKSELNQPFALARQLKTRLGYTDYQHTEISNGQPGAYFNNQSYEGRLEMSHQPLGAIEGIWGLQVQSSEMFAVEKLTGEQILPKALTQNFGLFALENYRWRAVDFQLGLRVEQDSLHADASSSLSYTPVSAALSAKWQVNRHHSVNLGLSRGARAPGVQELFTHGYHDATRSYELGNPGLQLETLYNLDLGYRFKTDWLRAEFDWFHNWAEDYIYQQRNGDYVLEAGIQRPVLAYNQQNAIFKGYEAKLVLPLMEHHQGVTELTLFSDYTRGQFVSGGDVPRMPPLRYGMEIGFSRSRLSSYLRLSRRDNQPYAGAFETSTAGYYLLDYGLNYQFKTADAGHYTLFLKATNLLNANIRNASSYLRNFAPEAGRSAELGIRVAF